MLTAYSLSELAGLPGATERSVVTIGNFDGVHIGHQSVLQRVVVRSREIGARSVVVTFDPHPSHVLAAKDRSALITPLPQKLELLAACDVDVALVLPFDDSLRTLSAQQFCRTVLQQALHTAEIHEGETFRFGHRAEADVAGLASLGLELGFAVHAYKPLVRRGAAVSSSRIRQLIAAGDMHTSRALLGRPFSLSSFPAKGRGYGTRYAVPTINLATPHELLPAHGVYATQLRIGEGSSAITFQGVTNAGNRPTFGEDSYAVETHLFDFRPIDLTERTPLQLTFLKRLREERRFPTPDALKQQIGKDVRKAQRLFALCQRLNVRS